MTTSSLFAYAQQAGIPVYSFDIKPAKSISIMDDNYKCYIGMDTASAPDAETKVLLAHELGHCETGAFYNRYSRLNVISKLEYKANRWAVQMIVSYDDLCAALHDGVTSRWELADYFDVTEDFIDVAINHYRAMGYDFREGIDE